MEAYQKIIAASRYARWLPEEGRRETWPETVTRYHHFWEARIPKELHEELYYACRAIEELQVMPSMRCLMTAGEALDRDNVAGFNCAYAAIDHPRALDELMYILLCGTGKGYSVENRYIKQLPDVPEAFWPSDSVIVVPDSKIGWAKSFKQLMSMLWAGEVPKWDVSKVRPAGAPLKTFGGRASGPQPLVDLFDYAVRLFREAAGRKFHDLEVSDLCCKIAEVIVVGGVRRSALICLCDATSMRMQKAKSGQWWLTHPERALANISAVYDSKPDLDFFMAEMGALYESKSGERGIFSRVAAKKAAMASGRREASDDFGCNPCSEIILRPNQFCNLSEVVVRAGDTLSVLLDKVRLATILGTLQATLTDFRYLRPIWKKNTEEEALLGVSLTGIMDHEVLGDETNKDLPVWLQEMRAVAVETNKEWAVRLGINPSVAITCVKPSGTVSQLVNSASGIHPRYSEYYIRTIRADKKDPLAAYMAEAGFPHEEDVHKQTNWVFSFPIKSPEGVPTASEVRALAQLDLWKIYQENWAEHKPSMTCYYRDDDFIDVMGWVWDNFDVCSGVSFLPYDGHVYEQAPYQPIDKETYERLSREMPEFDWQEAARFEAGVDSTTSSQELACTGGACELP